jgi:hypothetical protein
MSTTPATDTRRRHPDSGEGHIFGMARRKKDETRSEKADKPKRRNPIFYFMGPPDLGDPDEPPRSTARVLMNCSSCGRPMDEHTIDRSHGKSLTFCPPADAEQPDK